MPAAQAAGIVMSGHIEGASRDQATLFPETLDELIAPDSMVRVVDAFVGTLDLAALGFAKALPARTGRPSYAPGDLLKLYLYGYLNQTRSSRALERECRRNIEVLWLLNRLAPDFKTIADFRKDNRAPLTLVCRALVQFCRGEGLVGGALVAVDGSKFAGQNSPKRAWTAAQLEKKGKQLDTRIAAYLARLDEADAADGGAPDAVGDAKAALEALRVRRADLAQAVLLMQSMEISQVALSDPDSRLLRGPHGAVVGYNVQTAVDARHGLIVHHAVTQATSDQNQLATMAEGAKRALEVEALEVVADAGYADAEQLKACEAAGVTAFVPHPRTANPHGGFDRSRFVYEAESDTLRCPVGRALRFKSASAKNQARYYVCESCEGCALKARCTKAAVRWVSRHEHEAVLEALAARLERRPAILDQRRCLAEHPFGIIKHMMGVPRLLCRGLAAVGAEVALSVTAFNLKRAIALLGGPEILRRFAVAP